MTVDFYPIGGQHGRFLIFASPPTSPPLSSLLSPPHFPPGGVRGSPDEVRAATNEQEAAAGHFGGALVGTVSIHRRKHGGRYCLKIQFLKHDYPRRRTRQAKICG